MNHQDVLRAYIREIDQKGLLDEVSTGPKLPPPPIGTNTERWLDCVQTAPSAPLFSSEEASSCESSKTAADDASPKEMVLREENMKFPQSMKLERPKPETRRDGVTQSQL